MRDAGPCRGAAGGSGRERLLPDLSIPLPQVARLATSRKQLISGRGTSIAAIRSRSSSECRCRPARQVAVATAAPAAAAEAQAGGFRPAKPTLVTVPVSNCAARIRFIIYKKGLQDEIDVSHGQESLLLLWPCADPLKCGCAAQLCPHSRPCVLSRSPCTPMAPVGSSSSLWMSRSAA